MFSQNGLSLDQAPPLSVVFRFFFLGSLFGILGGVSLLFYGIGIFDISSIGAITFTHILSLGVMLSFMFAALFQMLPVIAGVRITSPIKRANLLLYPFLFGLIFLLLAFNMPDVAILFVFAGVLMSIAIIGTVSPMILSLFRLKSHSVSSKGMSISLLSLLVTLFFGLYLVSTLGGLTDGTYYVEVKDSHFSFALFGWVAILIISISFQVIEMFYVTPSYPKIIGSYLPLMIFAMLGVSSMASLFFSLSWDVSHIVLALLLSVYGATTLLRLSQRKRKITDATMWFWRVGMISLLLSMISIVLINFVEMSFLRPLSYTLFVSFALSIVFAMFYKIVPFLTWFHLSSQGYFKAPMMHEVIHPKRAKRHLYIHVAGVVAFLLAPLISQVIYAGAFLMIVSFSIIAYEIANAHQLYKKIVNSGERFDMGSMN